jgi:hypothetical protein
VPPVVAGTSVVTEVTKTTEGSWGEAWVDGGGAGDGGASDGIVGFTTDGLG